MFILLRFRRLLIFFGSWKRFACYTYLNGSCKVVPFFSINEVYTSETTRVARELPQLDTAESVDLDEEANEVADKIVPFSFNR